MRSRPGRLAALLACLSLWSSNAWCDERERCASASEDAQQLRIEGKLGAARERLLVCVRPACPAVVRSDCEQWLSEVDTALPTIIFGAQDATGHDLVDVRVAVDRVPTLERLDGKAVALDPGAHMVRFERVGSELVEDRIVVKQGEKNRIYTARFAAPPPAPSPQQGLSAAAAPSRPPAPGRREGGHVSPVAYVAGGLGAASLATFVVFAVKGQLDYDACRQAVTCTQSEADSVKLERALAWTTLGVGIVGIGVATWLLLHPGSAAPASASGLELLPVVGGAAAKVTGAF